MLKPTQPSLEIIYKLYREKPGEDNWIAALANAIISARNLQKYF